LDFILFILVTATLFVRPAEIVADLAQVPTYEILILGCVATSFPKLLDQLRVARLAEQPVTVCILGMLTALVMSYLRLFEFSAAFDFGLDFSKIVIYYLLLVSVVDTPQRLRAFLVALMGCIAVVAALAVLQYHGAIDIPGLSALAEGRVDPITLQFVGEMRLQGTGIFHDPNDLSLILVVGMVLAAYWITDRYAGSARIFALGAIGVFGYAFALTKSRGGMLALMGAVLALFYARYGIRKTIVLAALTLPLILVVFAGRQTDISTSEGTSQQRIQLWSGALTTLRSHPIFGTGNGSFVEDNGLVPHNSYVQCYVELGMFGGTAFFAAYYTAALILYRMRNQVDQVSLQYGGIERLRPYLLAIVVGYSIGLMSLSRHLVVPTYLVVGLAAIFPGIVGVAQPVRVDNPYVKRIALGSCCFVVALYLMTRLMVRWS